MDQATSLEHLIYKPNQYLSALRTIRPHPGIWLGPFANSPNPTEEEMRSVNTKGLDAFIVLLRLLTSFGFSMEKPTEFESLFLQCADKDLGWDEEEDWKIKKALHEKVSRRPSTLNITSFSSLLSMVRMRALIESNPQFDIYSNDVFVAEDPGMKLWQYRRILSHEPPLQSLRTLRFDSRTSLAEQVTSRFYQQVIKDRRYKFLSSRPNFLSIQYQTVPGSFKPISQLRVLQFKAPEAKKVDGVWKFGEQQARYHLIAVVKAHDGQESIRVYGKGGHELVPAKVGNLASKEAADSTTWSVEETGDYVLIFYRSYNPDGWTTNGGVEIDQMAPESKQSGTPKETITPQLSGESSGVISTPTKR